MDKKYRCYTVKKIGRKLPIIGKPIMKSIQWLCGKITGHAFDGDWGYGGGDTADVWCRHCDYFTQIPKTSIWFTRRYSKEMMEEVEK